MKVASKSKIIQYAFFLVMMGIAVVILAAPQIRILSEYMVHIMFGFFISGLFFLIINQKRLLITSFAICGMLCVILKNESNTDLINPVINSNPKVKLSHYNLANLENPYELVSSIQNEKADIISFQELTPDWHQILKVALSSEYEYNSSIVRIDPYGKGVYSKLPITSIDTLNNETFQDIKISCSTKGYEFTLFSTYVIPALDKTSKKLAKNQLLILSNEIKKETSPTLVFGDFNLVYWSEEISQFRSHAGLNNSRKDVTPASFSVPYDHIFYSKNLDCIDEGDVNNIDNEKIGYHGSYQMKNKVEEKIISKIN